MKNTVLPALGAFVLGSTLTWILMKQVPSVNPVDNSAAPAIHCEDLKAAKASLISISQQEYIEYSEIKDLKLKYERADELLGKIMLLFLADVGFRTGRAIAPEPTPSVMPTIGSGAPPVAKDDGIAAEANPKKPVEKTPSVESGLGKKSLLIKTSETEKQIHDVLDQAIVENPKLELAKGGVPTRKQVKILEGRYSGFIRHLDSKLADLTVVWDLQRNDEEAGMSGNFRLSINGPSRRSESNGTGNIDNIVSLAEDPDGFLVSSCGGDCYLQLYYNAINDMFYGNFYSAPKGSKAKPERIGLVEMRR